MDDRLEKFQEILRIQMARVYRLDKLIRKNRELASFRVATPDDMAPYQRAIDPGHIKRELFDWIIITFDRSGAGLPISMVLLGKYGDGKPICTSPISGIDPKRGMIQTQNSYYKVLGGMVPGEPEPAMCYFLADTFNHWGFGGYLGLPVTAYRRRWLQ